MGRVGLVCTHMPSLFAHSGSVCTPHRFMHDLFAHSGSVYTLHRFTHGPFPILDLSVPHTGSFTVSLPTLDLSVPRIGSCFFPPTDPTACLMRLCLGHPKFLRLQTPIQTQTQSCCTPNLVSTTGSPSLLLLSSGSWRSFESLLFDPHLIPSPSLRSDKALLRPMRDSITTSR